MKEQLKKKQVTLKLASNTDAVVGIVYEVEQDGIWIQPSTKVTAMNVKAPLMFIPFCQMEWLATPMTPEQLTGNRP